MKEKLLGMLVRAEDYLSGEMLCEILGVSRTAIWNNIKKLIQEGYLIDAVNNRGYKLQNDTAILRPGALAKLLNTNYIGRDGMYFDQIPSTNTYLKSKADSLDEGYIVLCDHQTKGRGRLGREWKSGVGDSIICSVLLKPKVDLKDVSKITLIGALAIRRALMHQGIKSKIKWPNDIVIGGKKVCGILTEMASELDEIKYVVLGFGLNVYQTDFGGAISHGTSLKALGHEVDRKALSATILDELETLYEAFKIRGSIEEFLEELNSFSATVGQEVLVIRGDTKKAGFATEILEDGSLKVIYDAGEETINYGEVSVRGIYDYV